MTAPALRPPSRPLPPRPAHHARAAVPPELPDDAARPETIELEVGPRKNGYRTFAWSVLVILLLVLGGGAFFVSRVHEPLALALDRTRAELETTTAARAEADAQRTALIAERDALTTERDAVRTERDALRARESALASAVAERDAQIGELQAMTDSLSEQLHEEIATGDVTIEQRDGRVAVRLADQILFAPGRAELSPRGRVVLRRVSTSLARMEDRIVQVEGHTDATPLSGEGAEFATNWELSAARATHVVRYLADECDIVGERLIAAGFGEFRPVADNGTAAGRRRNRRIELTLFRAPR